MLDHDNDTGADDDEHWFNCSSTYNVIKSRTDIGSTVHSTLTAADNDEQRLHILVTQLQMWYQVLHRYTLILVRSSVVRSCQ